MAARSCELLFLSLVFVAALPGGVVRAQGPSPAPSTEMPLAPGPGTSTDCTAVLVDKMSACLTYVEAGNNLTRPEKGCCRGFADVVNSQPLCLCSLLASNNVYGIQLNRTKSLMLPTVCRVRTPPVSVCAALGSPVPSPKGSTTPSATPVAGGPVPNPPPGNGADSSFRSSALALLAGLSFAAAAVF